MLRAAFALALAALPLLAGCRGDPKAPPPPSPIAQESGIQVDSVPAK